MISQPLFSRWVLAACFGAMQLLALTSGLGQVNPSRPPPRAPALRSQLVVNQSEQALVRARAAMRLQDFARAYTEYRSALNVAPRTGAAHDEALRGVSESGVKLAQQRIKEGRGPEAERIAREVLTANPNYRPALELLTRSSTVKKQVPLVGPTPSTNNGMQAFSAPTRSTTTPPMTATAPRIERSPPPTAPTPPPKKAKPQATPEETTTPDTADTGEMPEEGPPEPSPPPEQSTPAPVKQPLVKVFFATDRLPTGDGGPANFFGKDRNKTGDDHLVTGTVTVSIPPVHKEGKVERPFKWWIIEFKQDPKKHFVLTELTPIKGDDFYGALRGEYDRRVPEKRSAFVYIHGFNVSFDDAAFNTAQLAYDLDFEGVPIMYSWPSQGSAFSYEGDLETTDWSAVHLQTFLERVARESGALRIHVLAHSMGNRLLTSALRNLKRQPDIQPLFDNIIMAAPDVNADTFTEQIWPEIKTAAKRFTLYASSDDGALILSKKAKGTNDSYRLGEAGPNIVVISGLDTVDASGIDTSLLGHSYVDSCKPVMADLQKLIAKGLAPLQRNLRDRKKEGLSYWAFP
jgi:esterase/lipase superfamily enzyme